MLGDLNEKSKLHTIIIILNQDINLQIITFYIYKLRQIEYKKVLMNNFPLAICHGSKIHIYRYFYSLYIYFDKVTKLIYLSANPK